VEGGPVNFATSLINNRYLSLAHHSMSDPDHPGSSLQSISTDIKRGIHSSDQTERKPDIQQEAQAPTPRLRRSARQSLPTERFTTVAAAKKRSRASYGGNTKVKVERDENDLLPPARRRRGRASKASKATAQPSTDVKPDIIAAEAAKIVGSIKPELHHPVASSILEDVKPNIPVEAEKIVQSIKPDPTLATPWPPSTLAELSLPFAGPSSHSVSAFPCGCRLTDLPCGCMLMNKPYGKSEINPQLSPASVSKGSQPSKGKKKDENLEPRPARYVLFANHLKSSLT
jgi:hypothetical protein